MGLMSAQRERLRFELYIKQKGRCLNCKVKVCLEPLRPNSMQMDHINPKANGGSNEPMNFALLCLKCNLKKHDSLIDGLQRSLFDGEPKRTRRPRIPFMVGCKWCGVPIPKGRGTRRKAEYCSVRCKNAALKHRYRAKKKIADLLDNSK